MISSADKFKHLQSCVWNARSEFEAERFLHAKNWLGTAASIASELREDMGNLDLAMKSAELVPVEDVE